MIRFQTILWLIYFCICIASYPYIRKSYFPQNPSAIESIVSAFVSLFWFISVPITFIVHQEKEGEEI